MEQGVRNHRITRHITNTNSHSLSIQLWIKTENHQESWTNPRIFQNQNQTQISREIHQSSEILDEYSSPDRFFFAIPVRVHHHWRRTQTRSRRRRRRNENSRNPNQLRRRGRRLPFEFQVQAKKSRKQNQNSRFPKTLGSNLQIKLR